jgi:hypothetical protein
MEMNNIKYKLGEQLEFNGIAYKVTRIEIFQSKGGATIVIDLNDIEPEVEPEVTTGNERPSTGTATSPNEKGRIDYL